MNSFFGGFFDPPACHAFYTERVHPARDALVPYAAVLRIYLINLMTLDTRAAIFKDGQILLVRENNGKWSLPGGWCDVNISVGENAVKEVKEEAGLDVIADSIIAVQDRAKHNLPVYAYGICKIFVLCSLVGGCFQENLETTGFDYFTEDNLPDLATEKNTAAQIKMCFDAHRAGETWKTYFD